MAAPPPTPEQQAAQREAAEKLRAWRTSVSMDRFKALRKMFNDAGVTIYAWKQLNPNMSDDEMEYVFNVAEALGCTHTTLELIDEPEPLRRIGQFAEKKKIYAAYHTHLQGSMTAFDQAFAVSKGNMANVDLGHFVAAGGDPIAFIKKFNGRISSVHLKDRTTPANGQGNLRVGHGRYAAHGNPADDEARAAHLSGRHRARIRGAIRLRRREGDGEVSRLLQGGPGEGVIVTVIVALLVALISPAYSWPARLARRRHRLPSSSRPNCCPINAWSSDPRRRYRAKFAWRRRVSPAWPGPCRHGGRDVAEVTLGPLGAGAYRCNFYVDGVATVDPRNPLISESNNSVWSLVLMPGSEVLMPSRSTWRHAR